MAIKTKDERQLSMFDFFPTVEKPLVTKLGKKYEQERTEFIVPNLDVIDDKYLISNVGNAKLLFDSEVFPNYYLLMFKVIGQPAYIKTFEWSPDSKINKEKLTWIIKNFEIVTFNGNNYDMVLLWAFLKSHHISFTTLKYLNDQIIYKNARPRDIERLCDMKPEHCNHVDLIEVAPLRASLKMYAARLGCHKIQELPFNPNAPIGKEDVPYIKEYCYNDLLNTELMYNELLPQIKLREKMSREYGVDLRSKSDAQVAEAVITTTIERKTGAQVRSPQLGDKVRMFNYNIPRFIKYESKEMNAMLDVVRSTTFSTSPSGKLTLPEALEGYTVNFNQNEYRLGIGGLHSSEKSVHHKPGKNEKLFDRDVSSFYPAIILNLGLFPSHIGPPFLEVYRELVERRLEAKKNGDKATSDALKITINGSFGKFGSPYSAIYSPELLIRTTLTGQLSLLMLIEIIELHGGFGVSANTDGVIYKLHTSTSEEIERAVALWEARTGFKTEETEYVDLYSRDVNNYIAIKKDGSIKEKGCFAEKGSALNSLLSKNPQIRICIEAAEQYLLHKTPVEETITKCQDIRKFVVVRSVTGGGSKDGVPLGKTVRWYYKKKEYSSIVYMANGNKVATSDGAWPLMILPKQFPQDIDYDKYIVESKKMLESLSIRAIV